MSWRFFLVLLLCAGSARAEGMRIAVMEFHSGGASGGDLEGLGKGLQSMITTDLAQVRALQVVERSRLADIEAEIKLSRTALVDKTTAVKIGKLAGATHLVTGTFTVVGGQMRLDTRMFGVADGRIVLAEKIEGERDAFFELEKDLVKKLIDAVGVKLQPKERAEVTRIHTADFEAFRKFGQGVSLYDEKKYDEALAALRDAGSRDANFKLAAVTLEEYERVIVGLRSKADAIEAAQAQLERLKQDKGIRDEMEMVEKLYAVAGRSGAAAQLDRLAALHALALIYGYSDGYGHHEKLQKVQDEFALQRTAETLWKSYFAESVRVFPQVPLGVTIEVSGALPKPATFDKDFPKLVAALTRFEVGDFDHTESLLYFSLDKVGELSRRLLMDRRQEAELRARALELGTKLKPPNEWRRNSQRALAENLRAIGEYGKSTAILSSLGTGETEPYKLQDLAREIEKNRAREAALKSPQGKLARELVMLTGDSWSDDVVKDLFTRLPSLQKPTAWDLFLLARVRRFPDERTYVIVDGAPTWQVRGRDEVVATGPRTDPLRASELRYYRPERGSDALLIVDGVPRKDVEGRFEVSFAPPEDFWPGMDNPGRGKDGRATVDPRRPEVAFAFGARDIDAESRPLRSYQIAIAEDGVRLVEAVQADRWKPAAIKVLEEQRLDLRGSKKLEVTVRIAGSTIGVTVNGKALAFKAPADRTGFYGFQLRGPGFAAVKGWKTAGR